MLSTMSVVSSALAPIPTVSSCDPTASPCDVVMSAVCHAAQPVNQAPTDQQAGSFSARTTRAVGSRLKSTTLSGSPSRANSSKVDDLCITGLPMPTQCMYVNTALWATGMRKVILLLRFSYGASECTWIGTPSVASVASDTPPRRPAVKDDDGHTPFVLYLDDSSQVEVAAHDIALDRTRPGGVDSRGRWGNPCRNGWR